MYVYLMRESSFAFVQEGTRYFLDRFSFSRFFHILQDLRRGEGDPGLKK